MHSSQSSSVNKKISLATHSKGSTETTTVFFRLHRTHALSFVSRSLCFSLAITFFFLYQTKEIPASVAVLQQNPLYGHFISAKLKTDDGKYSLFSAVFSAAFSSRFHSNATPKRKNEKKMNANVSSEKINTGGETAGKMKI